MNETWKTLPSYGGRYEMCLETQGIRNKSTHNIINPNKYGVINTSYGLNGEKFRWGRSIPSLMNETFPYWWIETIEDDEEVKPVKGYSGYFITNKGRLYSTHTNQWMKPKLKPPYYYSVWLFYSTGEKLHTYLHTLVGKHFLPEWEEGLFVLHKDETIPYPEINYPSNLWIGDGVDNNRDRCEKGRSGGWMKGKIYNGVLQTGV